MTLAGCRAAIGALLLLLAPDGAASAGETLTLASGRSDEPTYAAGVGLSSLIKFELLPSDKIDLHALESSGAVDSARLLQSGAAQLAILPSAVGHAARLGTGSFAGSRPETGFRAIATLWRDALHMLVRRDDVATGTIDDLLALKDRRLFLGDAATGMIDANRLLLADLGLDAERAFELAILADGDGLAAIKRGEVDALSLAGKPPNAGFADLFAEAPFDLRLLDVTETQMTRVNGNHWLWTPYVIPAATYAGQDEDVWTIALSNILVVRADVDPDTVYAITRSLFENLDYLQRIDGLMADLSLDTALAGLAMPLHPGALRFFDEVGLIPSTGAHGEATSPPAPVGTGSAPKATPSEPVEPDPGRMPTRYPDADVAGEWPTGTGGPLLKTPPVLPPPAELGDRPKPYWRHRATL